MQYAVGVSTYFRAETLRAVCCGCEHTHTLERKPYVQYAVGLSTPILQRGNLTCSCGCEHTHTSERKPYVQYAVGVSTPILQRGNLMCSMLWVWAHPYFREETLCAVHCGCGVSHTLVKRQPCFQTCQMFWVWPHPRYHVKCLSALAFDIKQSQFPLFANGKIVCEDLYAICLKLWSIRFWEHFFP